MPSHIHIPVARKGKTPKGSFPGVPAVSTPVCKAHFKVHSRLYKTEADYRHSWWPHHAFGQYSVKRDRYLQLPEK